MRGTDTVKEWQGCVPGDVVKVSTEPRSFFTFLSARMDGEVCLWVTVAGGKANRGVLVRHFAPELVRRVKETKEVRMRKASAERSKPAARRVTRKR